MRKKPSGAVRTILISVFAAGVLLLAFSCVSFADTDVIAHGGGNYKGLATSNSLEAVTASMEEGYRLIELDIDLSADGKIIMIHDWNGTAEHYYGRSFDGKLTADEFKKLKVFDTLTPMDFGDLAALLAGYPDVRIVTDTKGDNVALLKAIAEQYPDLTGRMVPQIYAFDELAPVKALGYKDIILTTYSMERRDAKELAEFVKENGLYALTVQVYDKTVWGAQVMRDVRVYCHPENDYEEALALASGGVDGFYSGTLKESDFTYPGSQYYLTDNTSGKSVKLTDVTLPAGADVKSIVALGARGLGYNEYLIYSLDGRRLTDASLAGVEQGKHDMSVEVYRLDEEGRGSATGLKTDYILWKGRSGIRLLDPRFEYRLDARESAVSFTDALAEAARSAGGALTEEKLSVLEQSFIAKQGQTYYYDNGVEFRFTAGDENLEPRSADGGTTLIPLADACGALGAGVTMDGGTDKYIYVTYGDKVTQCRPGTTYMRTGISTGRLSAPVTIYRNKAFAGADLLSAVTGRAWAEQDGTVVIFPDGFAPDRTEAAALAGVAAALFGSPDGGAN